MGNVDRTQDEDHGRVYMEPSGPKRPSVTNLLNQLDTNTRGIEIWQSRNDGHGDNAFHEHLFWYKRNRGTLAHSAALSTISDKHLWSEDERSSLQELEAHKYDINRLYSIVKDHDNGVLCGRGDDCPGTAECSICVDSEADLPLFRREFDGDGLSGLMDVHWYDTQFVRSAFSEICDALGINHDSVLAAEQMFVDHDIGYGGQVDLAYVDPDGDVVVADLKTSSSVRDKHRIQGLAYANAFDGDVDRIEIIRMHPDSRTWQVHTHDPKYPAHTRDLGYNGEWYTEDNDELWEQFVELAQNNPLNADLHGDAND